MISIHLVYSDYSAKTTRAKIANKVINKIAAPLPRILFSQINDKYTKTVAKTTHSNDKIQDPPAHNVAPHNDTVAAITTSKGRLMPNIANTGTNIIPAKTNAT